jgi:hypothetical protein
MEGPSGTVGGGGSDEVGGRHNGPDDHGSGNGVNGLIDNSFERITSTEICDYLSQRTNRYILAETYACEDTAVHSRFLDSLQNGQKRLSIPSTYRSEQFYTVAYHPIVNFNHYHTLHLCTWNRSSCRCGRLELWHSYSLVSRRAYPIGRLDRESINNLIVYHLGGSRIPIYCEVAGKLRRFDCENRDLRQVPGCRATSTGVVEIPTPPVSSGNISQHEAVDITTGMDHGTGEYVGGQTDWGTSAAGTSHGNAATAYTTDEEGSLGLTTQQWTGFLNRLSKPKYRPNFSDLLILMKRFLNTPMNALPYNDDWFVNPKITEINHTGLIFDNAIRAYRSEINKLTLNQIFEYQTNTGCCPVYSAGLAL